MSNDIEESLLTSTYKGVEGVTLLDQGNPGPAVALFAVTHGNEISGVEALRHLMTGLDLASQTINGKIFLIIHNLNAYKKVREAKETRELGPNEFRYLDINLNRVFHKEFLDSEGCAHMDEVKRAKQITSLVPEFDYVLDLHSTSKQVEPMLIYDRCPENDEVARHLSVEKHVLSIYDHIRDGHTLGAYVKKYGKRGDRTISIAVESGSHYDAVSCHRAKTVAAQFLEAAAVVDFESIHQPTESFTQKNYRIVNSIVAKHHDFTWARNWKEFEPVQKGTLIAIENAEEVILDDDYIFIMPTKEPVVGAEAVYLAKVIED